MKVVCDGLNLSNAVLKVAKALPNKSLAPYLEGMKIVANNDTLTVSATDTDLTIQNVIKADVIESGEALVPGRFFSDYVKKLSNDEIQLSLNSDRQLVIKFNDSESTIQCLNNEEYPVLQRIDEANKFLIAQCDLKEVIEKVIFSASTDDSRAILKGALFEIEDYTITTVALDGYRLAMCKKPLVEKSSLQKAVVPSRSLIEISKLLEDTDETATVYLENNYMLVDLGETVVSTRLLSGDFINYKQIIPSQFKTVMKLNKNFFENALDRASIVSRGDKNNLVKFDIKENLLTVLSNSDIGKIKENLTISLDGMDLAIAFNARYFSDCLKVMQDEQIKISFNDSVTPCVVTPASTDEYLYLILPVRMAN